MRRLFTLLVIIGVMPYAAMAQLSAYHDRAVAPIVVPGTQISVLGPVQYGQVRICNSPASGSPCTPIASIFDLQGNALSVVGGNFGQLTTDVTGQFSFQCNPGTYQVQVAASASNTPQLTYLVTCPTTTGLPSSGTFTNLTVNGIATFNTNAIIANAGINSSGPNTLNGGGSSSGIYTDAGDQLFKSGRPWYDVMAFGAKNDGATDDTAAIQAAVTAACATSYLGGTVYFPPGVGYKSANTSTSPITISCNNLTFQGAGFSTIDSPSEPPSRISCPACTVPLFTDGGTTRFGFTVRYLGLQGNSSSATSTGISLGSVGDYTIDNNFFDLFGGSAIVTTSGLGGHLRHNFAQNCLLVRPASTDTGCFDLGNNDTTAEMNFVTTSNSTASGQIGTGHTYAWVIRGTNGFFGFNMGEISQQGWLVIGNQNQLIGNRAFLIQGNGFTVAGNYNQLIGNKAIDVSQTANGANDCFVLNSTENIGGNIVDANQCVVDGSSNGNNVRHNVTDNNSAGVAEFNANKYSNNRLDTTHATGVLYNMTGGAPYAVQQPHRPSTDRGDASVTVQCGLDAETQLFATALTANRTITFSTTGAYNGCHFHVVRIETSTGAFTLTTVTGGANAVLAVPGTFLDAEFVGSVWRVTGYSVPFTTGAGAHQTKAAVAGCTTAASIGGICATAVTVSWPVSFPNTTYAASCTPSGAPTNLPSAPYIVAKSAASMTVNYFAITAAAASWATIDCWGSE